MALGPLVGACCILGTAALPQRPLPDAVALVQWATLTGKSAPRREWRLPGEPGGWGPQEAQVNLLSHFTAHICAEWELHKYEQELKDFEAEQRDLREAALVEQNQKFNKTMLEFAATLARLAMPITNATQESARILIDAVKPSVSKAVMWVGQNAMRPRKPYNSSKLLTVEQVMKDFEDRMQSASGLASETLDEALTSMDLELDEVVQAFPQLAKAMPGINVADVPRNLTGVQLYLVGKVLPVLLAYRFPQLSNLIPLVVSMSSQSALSDSEASELMARKSDMVDLLPRQCHPAKLLVDAMLGFGDAMTRLAKFVHTCSSVLLPMQAPVGARKPPIRRCRTCEEQYKQLTWDSANPDSCISHCKPLLLTCMGGMDDDCIRGFVPCLRCHKNKLSLLHTCQGVEGTTPGMERLNSLLVAFQRGTTEREGVDVFLDALSKALLKGTFLDGES